MTDNLRVTVAPGARVILDPHPSGFPGLGPLVLEAGDTLFAEPAEAERLFQNGQVLSLATGKPIARRPAPMDGIPTIQTFGTSVQDTGLHIPEPRRTAPPSLAPCPCRAASPRFRTQTAPPGRGSDAVAEDIVLDDVVVTAPRHLNATTSDSAASAPKPPPASPPPARPNPAAPPGDALTLVIGDQRLQGWTDVHVTRGIEVFPSHFILTVTERTPGQPSKVSVDPGATCKVLIGNDLVLTGYVDTYSASVSTGGHTIKVVGRSQTEDLVDCAAGVKEGQETKATMTFSSPTLLQLAQDLCEPFGITVSEPDGEGTPLVSIGDGIPQFSIQLGQTVYDVLEPIARWKQMLTLDGTDGNLVLAKVGTKRAGSGFTMPGNVEDAKVGFRKQERFTIYLPAQFSFDNAFEVQPTGGGSGNYYQVVPDGAAFQGQPRVDGKARYRPHFVVSEQNLGGIYLAEFRAKWEKARHYGRSQAVTLTVSTWRDRNGDLWAPNTLATVDLPALKLANLTWLITEVTLLRGSNGTRATITLMPPEAFTPEPSFLTAFDPQIAQAQGDALRSQQKVLTDNSRSITNPGAGANGNARAGDAPGV